MFTIKVQLPNPSGLHARPASKLCAIARGYKSTCILSSEGKDVDIKRILDLMAANYKQGVCLEIKCDGADEVAAAEAINDFIQNLTE